MSNKYPQYFTADGFKRLKKRPTKRPSERSSRPITVSATSSDGAVIPATLTLKTANAKRLLRRRYVTPARSQGQTISPAAAKAIAAALSGMLHS